MVRTVPFVTSLCPQPPPSLPGPSRRSPGCSRHVLEHVLNLEQHAAAGFGVSAVSAGSAFCCAVKSLFLASLSQQFAWKSASAEGTGMLRPQAPVEPASPVPSPVPAPAPGTF